MDDAERLKKVKFVCDGEQLVDGGLAVRFSIRRGDQTLPGFAIRYKDEVRAFVNSCPHRGTSLDWQPGEVFDDSGLYLICATHGALFEPISGRCVDGPCHGASLKSIPVRIEDNQVRLEQDWLDLSN